LFPAITLVAFLFLIGDYFFTTLGIWSFNKEYIIGIKLLNLPIEEILFFFTIPYASIFIYEYSIVYFKKDYLKKVAMPITIAIIALAAILLVFNYGRLYTSAVLILLGAFMMQLLIISRVHWWGRFYMAYIIVLIPFLLISAILTAMPIIMYNDMENLGIRIGAIPIENTLYLMLLLLMNIALYEKFKKRFSKQ